ncbi:MAG: Hpt domain-containing protein [Treponema sp.]|nr:Hpt domain-containing protein [Spirochaetia bacterium]MDD7274590.1 Hpt domain-containing protein [Treponema sp.]MDY3755520.1 Hpt domain-containing protein [Treponema sp.]MDY4675150.1 Hpt domain-containing protein [Treponema sp.]
MENSTSELINLQEALERLDNDMDLYMILVDAFLQDTVFQADRMRELEKDFRNSPSGECLEAAQYIHRVKGAARQLGANHLATEAQKLEDIFRRKEKGHLHDGVDGVDTTALVEEVLELYVKTIEELKRLSN